MGEYRGYNWNDVLAYLISTDIMTFFLIFVFVILGGICRDYLDIKTKVKILRTIAASFVLALGLFAYQDSFSDLNVLLLFAYIFGYTSNTVHILLFRLSSDENIIRKILLKLLGGITNNLSDILEDDGNENNNE